MTPTRQDKSIAEHLAFYAAHEAFHTGQIVIDLPAAGQPVTEPTTVGASVEVGSEIL